VDANNNARVVRWELDYDAGQGGGLAGRADYTGWTTVSGCEVPTQLDLEMFDGSGNSLIRCEYSASNMQVGGTLDDSLFYFWTPPDSSTLH
jgi:hypothetical protein